KTRNYQNFRTRHFKEFWERAGGLSALKNGKSCNIGMSHPAPIPNQTALPVYHHQQGATIGRSLKSESCGFTVTLARWPERSSDVSLLPGRNQAFRPLPKQKPPRS